MKANFRTRTALATGIIVGGITMLLPGATFSHSLAASATLQDKPQLIDIHSLRLAQVSCAATFFGPSGGSDGVSSTFLIPNAARIVSLQIRSGQNVDGITINYLTNTGIRSSFLAGGTGGFETTINFAPGETITRIAGRYGAVVDSITIQTNFNTYGPFGGTGGPATFDYTVPSLYQIAGFRFRSASLIDAIGLGIRRTNCTA
ncbi:MAG TPA: jacalin-like lectin [Nostoc sp.]|uniref:jacalin-like lectin n=1 Tax=Nostoc sp. TaxID=1180 RepID=UPI002D71344D|nr:jacalin-like lectin [Nostoc sp.]HYX17893.1 jacalin-like lectin [Nostoc sp.]